MEWLIVCLAFAGLWFISPKLALGISAAILLGYIMLCIEVHLSHKRHQKRQLEEEKRYEEVAEWFFSSRR
jgi:phosphate/sulfate permease